MYTVKVLMQILYVHLSYILHKLQMHHYIPAILPHSADEICWTIQKFLKLVNEK